MAPLLIALVVFAVIFFVFLGNSSLPEQARSVDPDAPDESGLALRGLGILAFTFVVMAGALVVVTQLGSLDEAILPQAFAR